MDNKNKTGKKVFDTLAFQYKPLEKELLKFLADNGELEVLSKYSKANYISKIRILDKFAEFIRIEDSINFGKGE